MIETPELLLAASILLRVFGVAFSLLLLYRLRDYRFGFLTLMLSLMALRQLFTFVGVPVFTELPGLIVSVLAIVVVYYLLQYTRQERSRTEALERTNQQLKESRNRLKAMIEASPDDRFVFDSDKRLCTLFSADIEAVPDSSVGQSVDDLYPEEVVGEVESAIEKTLRDGTVVEVEYSQDDGETVWYAARTARISVPDDDDRALFVRRDITARKRREGELRRFKQAVEAAGAAVYITDLDEIIRYVNPAFEAMTGYTEDEILGQTPAVLSSGIHDEQYFDRLWSTILDGRTWHEEIVNERRSGEHYHANQTITPVFDDSGEIEEFVAIQIETTERKHRERQLQVLDRLLRHNLRNEMTVILGHAATIESRTDGELAESAATIRERGKSLLSKADTEREVVRLLTEPQRQISMDLFETLEQHRERVVDAWPDATIDLDVPRSATVTGIPDLPDAIGELFDNAVEHTGPSPHVRITAAIETDTVSLRITDDGPGLPEQEQEVLLGNLEVDSLHHGTGMGLWYVHWVIQLSDGSIGIETDGDSANTVVLSLPRSVE